MPALNFPTPSAPGEVYTANGKTFVWNGVSWVNNTPRSFAGVNVNGSITERIEVAASAATGTINFEVKTYGLLYNTVNATENWTLNVRGDSATTLNNLLDVGQTVTITHVVAVGASSYLPTGFTVDGSAVSVKWQNSATLTAYTSSTVVYTYFIVKTASNTYTVLGSQENFVTA